MLFVDIIRKKRDGGELTAEEIGVFVDGLADASLPAEQVSALAMAVCLRSMSVAEAGALTAAMARSGTTLQWDAERLGGPVVDKHSTGGVGDKVSFMLAPIAAACGCFVPMISGRGLGHTGGTLDKIASVPGYCATPTLERLQQVVAEVGCAIIGQTDELAPADRRFYAIRDITGTVESIPLITASILSKKIAAGNRSLVMDIKMGSGAFMADREQATELAWSLIRTAGEVGLRTHALVTDMNQVLGDSAGNALEIAESVEYLLGTRREARLHEVVRQLCAEMLLVSGIESQREAALARVQRALDDGSASEVFARMLSALGGPADFLERYRDYLPVAPCVREVAAPGSGYLAEVDTRAVGNAVIGLGGGRRRLDDRLDLAVGFSEIAPIGSELGPGRPLATVHAASEDAAERAAEALRAACRVAEQAPPSNPVVYDTLAA